MKDSESKLIWPMQIPKAIETVFPKSPPIGFRTTCGQGRYHFRQGNTSPNPHFTGGEESLSGYLLGFYNYNSSVAGLWRFYVQQRNIQK